MKIYATVLTMLFLVLLAVSILGYLSLQDQIDVNASTVKHNETILQQEIIEVYKRKPVNKFYVIVAPPSSEEAPSKYDPKTDRSKITYGTN